MFMIMFMLIFIAIIIFSITIIIISEIKDLDKYILVEKQEYIQNDGLKKVTSLYFHKELYNNVPEEVKSNCFFVKVKGNSLFIGRKIFKIENLLNGFITYDYDGYEPLSNEELKREFESYI